MELKDVFQLWERFEVSHAAEFELEMHGIHVKMKKDGANKDNNAERNAESVSVKREEMVEALPESTKTITSPLVGTFYRASSSDANPFVKEGDQVKEGDVIGIVEAMKLMNEVKADASGVVVKVLANDASMVEYGQPLLQLR